MKRTMTEKELGNNLVSKTIRAVLLVAFVMAFLMAPISTQAQQLKEYYEYVPGGYFTYCMYSGGGICITGWSMNGEIRIPSEIDGQSVIGVSDWSNVVVSGDATSIYIPSTVKYLEGEVFKRCSSLKSITVDAKNNFFYSDHGVLYSKQDQTLYCYPPKKKGKVFHVPSKVKKLGDYAFRGVSELEVLYIDGETAWDSNCWGWSQLIVYYKKGGLTGKSVAENGDLNQVFVCIGETSEKHLTKLGKKIKQVVSEVITDKMSDKEKAKKLHDWIIMHAHYSDKYHDAEGILLHGEGVCEAYARAYKMLLDWVGIPNEYVSGQVDTGEGHAWNRVKIDGSWYHIDCTWDDPTNADGSYQTVPVSGMERSKYFMKKDQDFEISWEHGWSWSWNFDLMSCFYSVDGGNYRLYPTYNTAYLNSVDDGVRKLKIPSTITYWGKEFKVMGIDAYACFKKKKLTTVEIGGNMERIEKCAFAECENLKTIVIKGKKLNEIGLDAFRGIHKQATFKCSNSKLEKTYKKLFKNSGMPKQAKFTH